MLPRRPHVVFAAIFATAALYHFIGALGFAFFLAPQWRHAVWVAIDGGMAYALLHPRPWLIAPLAAVTLWSLYSHGWILYFVWHATGQIRWLDLAVVLTLPLMLVWLICDARISRAAAVR